MVIGIEQVDRLIETTCSPMPMAHSLVRGIAFEDRRPVICVVLSRKAMDPTLQRVSAVLLVGAGAVAWALCVDQVLGVVPLVSRSSVIDERLPRWLSRVRSQDGRTLASLDSAQMVLDIGGAR